MKKIFGIIAVVIILLLALYLFDIRPDYSWPNDISKELKEENWVEVKRVETYFISKPWTWFFQQPVLLVYAKKSTLQQLDHKTYLGMTYIIDYDGEFSGEGYIAFNCEDNLYFPAPDINDIIPFNSVKISWERLDKEGLAYNVVTFYCDLLK